MRSKQYYFQNAAIIVLALAIIVMSVGYATYTQRLELTGTTKILKSKWSVIFANAATDTDVTTIASDKIKGPNLDDSTTILTFEAELGMNKTYSFTVDVYNEGTFDAKLTDYALTAKKNGTSVAIDEGATSYSNAYLTYTIKWDDNTNIQKNETLTKGQTKTMRVTVTTAQPADYNDLPTTADETYKFELIMNYGQV